MDALTISNYLLAISNGILIVILVSIIIYIIKVGKEKDSNRYIPEESELEEHYHNIKDLDTDSFMKKPRSNQDTMWDED